jgi:hypothetical protein
MRFDSELPQDMQELLEKWRVYSKGRIEKDTEE